MRSFKNNIVYIYDFKLLEYTVLLNFIWDSMVRFKPNKRYLVLIRWRSLLNIEVHWRRPDRMRWTRRIFDRVTWDPELKEREFLYYLTRTSSKFVGNCYVHRVKKKVISLKVNQTQRTRQLYFDWKIDKFKRARIYVWCYLNVWKLLTFPDAPYVLSSIGFSGIESIPYSSL